MKAYRKCVNVLWFVLMVGVAVFFTQSNIQAKVSSPVNLGSWEKVASPTDFRLNGVEMVSQDNVYAVGGDISNQKPIVLRYNGQSWQVDDLYDPGDSYGRYLTDVAFTSANKAWSVGYQSIAEFSGGNWDYQSPTATFLYGIDMVSANYGVSVGAHLFFSAGFPQYGSIHTYDGGSWREETTDRDETYLDVDMLNAQEGWIVGDGSGGIFRPDSQGASGGVILHRATSGSSWQVEHRTSEILFSVSAVSSNDVWAVGNNGLIIHYNGSSWQTVSSPVSTDLQDIEMMSSDEGWIVGEKGTILYYSNGAWTSVYSPTGEHLRDVEIWATGEAWAVGDDGTILHYQPPVTLTIDHATGAPGSVFGVVGTGFPADDTAMIFVNGVALGTVPTSDAGSFAFELDSADAEEGSYIVTATVNPTASLTFKVDAAAPIRTQSGAGTLYNIPANSALDNFVYMPVIEE